MWRRIRRVGSFTKKKEDTGRVEFHEEGEIQGGEFTGWVRVFEG